MNFRPFLFIAPFLLLAGCAGLSAPQANPQSIYVLEAQAAPKISPARHDLILAIGTPQARSGFDTAQMAYVEKSLEINYFATSRWADEPAHLLEALLLQAHEQTGGFRAVVPAQGVVPADVRLDTELLRLQQDFTTRPSRVQLTLRAHLIDLRSKRVLAVKQFDETEVADNENAYGGVTAANRALQRVLNQITEFCIRESAPR